MDATPNELLEQRIAKRKRQNVERVLRCRKRKQSGARCVRIEVTDWAETLDAFIKIGVLAEEHRNDDTVDRGCHRSFMPAGLSRYQRRTRDRIEMTIDLGTLSAPDRRSSVF